VGSNRPAGVAHGAGPPPPVQLGTVTQAPDNSLQAVSFEVIAFGDLVCVANAATESIAMGILSFQTRCGVSELRSHGRLGALGASHYA
jgi:hypothetical protein